MRRHGHVELNEAVHRNRDDDPALTYRNALRKHAGGFAGALPGGRRSARHPCRPRRPEPHLPGDERHATAIGQGQDFIPSAEIVRDGEDAVVRLELPGLDVLRSGLQ